MNYTLKILSEETDDAGQEIPVVLVHLGELDPASVALVVLNAIKAMPPTKKKRSDAGKSRKPAAS